PDHGDHRQHDGGADAPGQSRSRCRRRRPDCGQWRHREQDRDLRRRGARARAQHPVLCGGAAGHHRPEPRRRRRHSDRRAERARDETSAAVVEETGDTAKPWAIRSNVVASQVAIHREWGGVVPELASRQHIRDICGVVERSLEEGNATWADLGAVAVTQGPGLVGSLLVGVSFAKSAAAAAGLPLVAVHHLAGHIESLVLQNGELPLPAIVLVVSGGHTSLYLVDQPGHYQLLSRTRDDAAGEAYDKVAKLLGLGYPGGPVIDGLASTGNDRAIALPTTRLTHADRNRPALKGDLDFSF